MANIKRHKCYISYKFKDQKYRDAIVNKYGDKNFINRSQNKLINSDNQDEIMRQIREKWLKDTTVTIFLIGTRSFENYQLKKDKLKNFDSQYFIRNEIRASLNIGKDGKRNGLLGVVLPEMMSTIYSRMITCPFCHSKYQKINIKDSTVIKEFGRNYIVVKHKKNNKCLHYNENDRYAVLVSYDDFMNNPDYYIDLAYKKRNTDLADKVIVRGF